MTWNYIAGFFDGEGSITNNKKGYRITLPQTNLEVLTEIKEYIGCEHLFKETKRKDHWKDNWVYYIAKQEDILFFLKKICNALIVKKKEAEAVIQILRENVNKMKACEKQRIAIERKAKELRKEGMAYREIGKRLGIDFGHARRIILK